MADFYLQLRTNSMTLKNLKTHEEYTAEGEFSSSRLIVGDFYVAQSLLIQLIDAMKLSIRLPLTPHHRIVIQALEKNEGGLSPVEVRLLEEITVTAFNHKLKKVIVSHDELPMPQRQVEELLDNK
ncbi:YjaA family stress response protein [Providencia stuartii]|uniref:YjaA family stress response protein n=1 Tax=Providencia stuartii TaxID=588 RepID=UPI0012B5AB07|nr:MULTISPECIES: YjaA family stress response protein [Providencia]MDT2042796.1 hypothetical protein [Providencia stuartii]MTC12332.1 hypothetical protein [Providencia stuartii]GHB98414.1 hypothetical protein GCM10007290_27720 [Providencia thailandensis]HEM7145433.1 hypothetical protein [Providencia stuartii]